MANNLKINVTKSDFFKKPAEEQRWMLYCALQKIDQEGCTWAKNNIKGKIKRMYAIAAGTGLVGGVGTVLAKMAIWK